MPKIPKLNLNYHVARHGSLNLPGPTAASKQAVEELLLKDAETHHCFFKASGFHNHLSHHLLAAYDLGAPAGLLQKIYDDEARVQRPIVVEEKDEEIVVSGANWRQHLGNQAAYKAYVTFFAEETRRLGPPATFRKYIFEEGRESDMLVRLMSGALHPLIQVGYGAEFLNSTLIATGLAQAAVHSANYAHVLNPIIYPPESQAAAAEESKSSSLLHLFREVYDTPELAPPLPYDPDMLFRDRVIGALSNGGDKALVKLCQAYNIHPTHGTIHSQIEQIIWVATLLTFATSKPNRKPRLDFFLMHLLTSSLFLRPIIENLLGALSGAGGLSQTDFEMQTALLRAYIPSMIVITLARGRPRIDATTLMSHTPTPRPPAPQPRAIYTPSPTSLNADPTQEAEYNPWPALLDGVMYHPDSHVLKTMRSLAYAAKEYGTVSKGQVIGAFYKPRDAEAADTGEVGSHLQHHHHPHGVSWLAHGEQWSTPPTSGAGAVPPPGGRPRANTGFKLETHKGTMQMDGSIFVRAAGVLMDTLGWVGHGQKEGDWDRSALGWEDAWKAKAPGESN